MKKDVQYTTTTDGIRFQIGDEVINTCGYDKYEGQKAIILRIQEHHLGAMCEIVFGDGSKRWFDVNWLRRGDYNKKLICIDNGYGEIPFTVGDVYTANANGILTGDNGHKYMIYSTKRFVPYDEELFQKLKKEKEEKRLKMMDVDPYGEEIWESVGNKFKIGDKVIYIGWNPDYNGKTGVIDRSIFNGRWLFLLKLDEIVHKKVASPGYLWVLGKDLASLEEFEKRKNKYKDIDPYGEEIWESVDNKFKIGDTAIYIGDQKYMFGGNLLSLYGKKCEIFSIFRGHDYHIRFPFSVNHSTGWSIKFPTLAKNLATIEEFEKMEQKRREKLLKYKDIDPYGEEIWENIDTPQIDLKNINIEYDNYDEMIAVAKCLNGIGYETYTPVEQMRIKEWNHFFYDDERGVFARSHSPQHDKTISASNFLKIYGGKYKKIERPDLDPYGEEDWGWEEIKENLNESYYNNDVYIQVKSSDEYDELMKFLDSKGFVWGNGHKTNEFTPSWAIFGEFDHSYICPHNGIDDKRIYQTDSGHKLDKKIIVFSVPEFIKSYDNIENVFKSKKEKEEKRKEELRLKMMEIDPYGEEDWLDESKIIKKFESFESDKDITVLNLSNKGLTELPDLSHLTKLIELYCFNNQLTELPDLSHLTNLRYLYCYNNQLTELPDLSNLTDLGRLSCDNNQLTELPDLSRLTNLERLYCSNNQLTELPDLSNLTNLRILSCSNNQLTELPDLSNLTNLRILSCSNNQLTELPDLSRLTNLERLYCFNNQLTELPDLSNLTNLTELYCYNNQLPYNNLEGYKKWLSNQNKYTPEEKERIRLKHLEIDPYGEEDWLDESKIIKTFESFKKRKKKRRKKKKEKLLLTDNADRNIYTENFINKNWV